jgi:DNA repair protein RecN (Recombination protein N)
LEKVEERLDLVRRLIKKYGGSLEEAVKLGEQAKRELQELESGDEALKELSQQVADAHAKVVKLAQALSRKRTKAAGELEKRLERELKDLRMEHAWVRIAVEQETDSGGPKLTSAGMDRVEFLFSSNLGENPQPLARIASGGELSRVMLAMKTVLAEQDRVPVLVFDEVDAGIGGAVSEVVGKRLRHLSQHGHQVFCITHLAPIAAQAQRHFAVTKAAKSGRTVTQVATLDKAGRVEEVARMLGGEKITPTIRSTAAEMLKQK